MKNETYEGTALKIEGFTLTVTKGLQKKTDNVQAALDLFVDGDWSGQATSLANDHIITNRINDRYIMARYEIMDGTTIIIVAKSLVTNKTRMEVSEVLIGLEDEIRQAPKPFNAGDRTKTAILV